MGYRQQYRGIRDLALLGYREAAEVATVQAIGPTDTEPGAFAGLTIWIAADGETEKHRMGAGSWYVMRKEQLMARMPDSMPKEVEVRKSWWGRLLWWRE